MKVPKRKWDRKFEDIFPNADTNLFAKSDKTDELNSLGIDFHSRWDTDQKTSKRDLNFAKVSGYGTSYVQNHESSRRMRRRLARVMGKYRGL